LWQDVKSKRTEVEAERVLLANAKADRDTMVSKVDAARAELDPVEKKANDYDRLTGEKATLGEKITSLESERDTLKQQLDEAVQKVRLAYIGKTIPELRLENGMVLRDVKLQRIGESEVGVAHAGGMARLSTADLPPNLRDILRIHSAAPRPAAAVAAATAPGAAPQPAAAPAGTPAATEPAPPAVVLNATQQNQVDAAQSTLRTHEKRQVELQRTRSAYLAQVQDYRDKDSKAKFMGKPERYTKIIPKITQAINDIDAQLADVSVKIATLQMQVSDIKDGRAPQSPQ
jgi:hypothetical protein